MKITIENINFETTTDDEFFCLPAICMVIDEYAYKHGLKSEDIVRDMILPAVTDINNNMGWEGIEEE